MEPSFSPALVDGLDGEPSIWSGSQYLPSPKLRRVADLGVALFDVPEASDRGPAEHGEPIWSYLSRSGREEFARARHDLEAWFERLCPTMQRGVKHRLQGGDNHEFAAAYWELFLHELLLRLDYDVACEIAMPNGKNIDFLVRRGDHSMYVEATTAGSSPAERAADARRNRLYRELDGVRTNEFMLGIEIRKAGPGDLPNVAVLRTRVQAWLTTLTAADGVASDQAPPTFAWEDAGWALTLEAFPVRPELRGQRVVRPLGMFMDETGGLIDDETRLRRALRRKAPSRYGDLTLPYVIAVNENPWDSSEFEWHRTNVMYGAEAVAFGSGQPARSIRRADGYWRGPGQRPRNRRLGAVLFGARVYPWRPDEADLEWWANPFAITSVPDDMVPEVVQRRSLLFTADGGHLEVEGARRPLHGVFDT